MNLGTVIGRISKLFLKRATTIIGIHVVLTMMMTTTTTTMMMKQQIKIQISLNQYSFIKIMQP